MQKPFRFHPALDQRIDGFIKRTVLILGLCFTAALHAATGNGEQKVLVVQGKADESSLQAGDKLPAMKGRPKELRPGSLPSDVRYKFASDAAVKAAADLITQHLIDGPQTDKPLFADTVFVYVGAWKVLGTRLAPLKTSGPTMTNMVPLGSQVLKLEMAMLQEKEDVAKLEQTLAEIVKHDGGGRVRALRTPEMKKWWAFIAFDIQEPTLVLETKNKAHLFILDVGKDGLVGAVDELNSLPD